MTDNATIKRRKQSVYRAVFVSSRWSLPAFAALWGLAANHSASAETIRADTSSTLYQQLGASTQYAASGYITVNAGSGNYYFGSATLIAPDWVLTSADLVTQSPGAATYSPSLVNFGQGATATVPAPSSVTKVIAEPAWSYDFDSGNDLALVQLSTPVTTVAPAILYRSSQPTEIGQTATIIGYGESGTGLTGQNTAVGTRLGLQNSIDAFGGSTTTGGTGIQYGFSGYNPNLMLTDFDEPNVPAASLMGSSSPLTLEGSPALGDSGGGVFFTIGNQTYLAGVTSFTGAFNNNPLSTTGDGHYGDFSAYTRLSVSESSSFIDSTLQTASNWNLSGGGTWDSLADWSGNLIPEFAGATANFAGGISTATTVTLDANWTVGTIAFNNTHSYTIASGNGGLLTLDNGGNGAAVISDGGGTHTISANVQLNSPLNVTVTNPGDTLKITGNLSNNPNNGGETLTLMGSGTLALSGTNTYTTTAIKSGTLVAGSLHALPAGAAISNNAILLVQSGTSAAPVVIGQITGTGTLTVGAASTPAYLQLQAGSGTSSQSAVTVATNSTLDITNNILTINYGSSVNDPAAAIRADLQSGYNGDKWTGDGIVSSNAAANPALYAVGYADGNTDSGTPAAANQIYIVNTVAGDANLDGVVNFPDLLVVAQNYGKTGEDWAHGDFNYDGVVNFPDLLVVAQNYGKQLTAGQLAQLPESFTAQWQLAEAEIQANATNVPEPAAGGLLALGAAALMARRRRGKIGALPLH